MWSIPSQWHRTHTGIRSCFGMGVDTRSPECSINWWCCPCGGCHSCTCSDSSACCMRSSPRARLRERQVDCCAEWDLAGTGQNMNGPRPTANVQLTADNLAQVPRIHPIRGQTQQPLIVAASVRIRCRISTGRYQKASRSFYCIISFGAEAEALALLLWFPWPYCFFCARHRQRWEKTMIKLVQIAAFWETILKHFGTTSSQSPTGCSKSAPDCPATLNPCRMFLFESPFLLKSRPMTLRTTKMFICCLVFCGSRGFDDFGRGFRSVDVYNLHNWHGSGLTAPIWGVWCTRLMWTAVARWIILSYRLNLGGSGLGVCKVYRSLMFDKLRDV